MPPPYDGNQHVDFVELMRLQKIDNVTYQSITLPYSPGGQNRRAYRRSYGGHVYAQAAWAACQTVKKGLQIYNVLGTFLLPGQTTVPFIYHIQKVRDGRSFSTRAVHVTQQDSQAICFSGLVSFKLPESSPLDVQEQVDLWEKYKAVLQGKKPADFPECPSIDMSWYIALQKRTGTREIFPGLEQTKPDMRAYDGDKHPLDRRCLMFYRVTGALPRDDPNLHLCAHLYASDRNSLYVVANQLDLGDLWKQMASLVHMTSFHGEAGKLLFGASSGSDETTPMDDSEKGRWFAIEDWSTRSANGRTILQGRLWAPDGTQIGTITQDGLIRYTEKPEATGEELEVLREKERRWKPRGKL